MLSLSVPHHIPTVIILLSPVSLYSLSCYAARHTILIFAQLCLDEPSSVTSNKGHTVKPSLTPRHFPFHCNRCWETAINPPAAWPHKYHTWILDRERHPPHKLSVPKVLSHPCFQENSHRVEELCSNIL